MSLRDLRQLVYVGAMGEIRWAVRLGVPEGSGLAHMLSRQPRRLGCDGHGQPYGAHCLGADDEEGELSRSRRDRRLSAGGLA